MRHSYMLRQEHISRNIFSKPNIVVSNSLIIPKGIADGLYRVMKKA